MTASPTSYSVMRSFSVTLQCAVSANPSATRVQWQHTSTDDHITTIQTSRDSNMDGGTVSNPSLTIHNVTSYYQGYYTCSADNAVGTGSSDPVLLTVTGGKCVTWCFM